MREAMRRQIARFLDGSIAPRVRVAESRIVGENDVRAGRGVFSIEDVSADQLPAAMCIYPGVFSPGIPPHAAMPGRMGRAEYLANLSSPSDPGKSIEDNAYLLNLDCGGYLDGRALKSQYDGGEMLDGNPSACGQLVNHAFNSNLEVLSFAWNEVLEATDASAKMDGCYALPNELRADGSPWYYDANTSDMMLFPRPEEPPLSRKLLRGAALVLFRPIERGEELLLDYGLKEPYPKWAVGWYNASADDAK
ncbi:hypothetical protein ACHAXT_006471 [Thalassiosira profunda]